MTYRIKKYHWKGNLKEILWLQWPLEFSWSYGSKRVTQPKVRCVLKFHFTESMTVTEMGFHKTFHESCASANSVKEQYARFSDTSCIWERKVQAG